MELKELFVQKKIAKAGELALVLVIPLAVIMVLLPLVGDDPLQRQAIAWVANVIMLGIVWGGLRARGQGWGHFGLNNPFGGSESVIRFFLKSLAVFAIALTAFVIGSVIGANIVGVPEVSQTSNYNYLQGNLPMLLLALLAVYVVSSFGEEAIYRGFLIMRLTELSSGSKKVVRAAVVISSIIFGLIHFDWGVIGIIQTTCMGLALGASYIYLGRNLSILILAHAYMDTILLIQMYLPAS